MSADDNIDLLLPREAAEYLRSSTSTLSKWRLFGTGPRYVTLGRLIRYRRRDLDAWLDGNTRSSTADAA